MKIYVDDIRDAPPGWTLARTISEAVSLISLYRNDITHVSLDHDISIPVKVGDILRPYPSPDTFKVVAMFICELMDYEERLARSWVITTHSSNPDGRQHIIKIFSDYRIKCTETPAETAARHPL